MTALLVGIVFLLISAAVSLLIGAAISRRNTQHPKDGD